MKLSTVLTALVVVVPIFSGQALAATQGNKGTGKGAKGAPPAKNNATASNNAASNTTSNNTGSNNNAGGGDPATSTTLDSSVISGASNFIGVINATTGTSKSATSPNNFINVCVGKTLTNGTQNKAGSCNTTPMGDIPAVTNMPSCKFVKPTNGEDLTPNTSFDIALKTIGMQTGTFTDAANTYFAAPQQVNGAGQIIGHNHVVVEQLQSFTDTTPTDPQKFKFFKALESPAVNSELTTTVAGGLPPGFYRISTLSTSGNHAPIVLPVAQHGTSDDAIYFSVGQGNGGNAFNGGGGNGNNANNTGNNNAGNNTTTGNNNASNTTATGNNNAGNTTTTGNNNAGNTTTTGNNNAGNTTTTGNNNAGNTTKTGNTNNTGKNGGNVKNGGKNGGTVNKQGNKGTAGRRRMVARLARDY